MITNSISRLGLTQIFLDRTRMDEVTTTYMVKAGGYRYGFNGMEKDDEAKGKGNSYDFGARMYDARLGRFLSLDNKIKEHPSESPYSAFRNSPILYVDHDGNEWINAHTSKIKELEKKALDNPDDKEIIVKQIMDEKKKEAHVASYIENILKNDVALYNYIDQLQVENANGDKINVKVNVSVTDYDANQKDVGKTMYTNQGDFIKYKDLEGNEGYFAPINKDGEIGFDVTLNGKFSFNDETLANEAGDVMFRMEYPEAARKSGTDKGKPDSEYRKEGTAGNYSERVQELYTKRKRTGSGKDPNNNPYPLLIKDQKVLKKK